MSGITLLMGLLLLSYIGSFIIGGRTAHGLPSGVEFLGLGFAVGPHALGLVDRTVLADFDPIVQVALGWLAFIVGLDFGRVNGRRVRAVPMVLGVVCASLTGLLVAFVVFRFFAYASIPGLERTETFLFAAGAGAVTAETTRFVVQWVSVRWRVQGPVSSLLIDVTAADDFAPIVAAGAIFAAAPSTQTTLVMPALGWFFLSLGLGTLLGTVTALLLRGSEGYALWGALIGTLLLGVGIATRFAFCAIFVTFMMGIALAGVSPHRRALRRMVTPTERAVLYPMLLLAGARVDLRPMFESRTLIAVVGVALAARIFGKLISGLVLQFLLPTARPAGVRLGFALLSSGPVSVSCAFIFAIRFPGRIGDTLLVCAAASAVLGELVSTVALKGLLKRLGELSPRTVAAATTNRASLIPAKTADEVQP